MVSLYEWQYMRGGGECDTDQVTQHDRHVKVAKRLNAQLLVLVVCKVKKDILDVFWRQAQERILCDGRKNLREWLYLFCFSPLWQTPHPHDAINIWDGIRTKVFQQNRHSMVLRNHDKLRHGQSKNEKRRSEEAQRLTFRRNMIKDLQARFLELHNHTIVFVVDISKSGGSRRSINS